MRDLKMSWLSALIAAIEEGSIRAAARRMGITQPAVTRIVRDLEQEVGTQLLTRSAGGVIATPQGNVLYEHARRAIRELLEARTQLDQFSGHMVGEISLSAVPLAVMLLVPEAMRTFGKAYPLMTLRLREEPYIERLRLLRAGKVDIAIGPIPGGIPASDFDFERLMPVDMAVVVGRNNPLARASSLEEVQSGRWVYTSAQLGYEDYAKLLFENNGLVPPTPTAVVNSTLSVLALVTTGDYVALMPLDLARHPLAAPHLTVVPVHEGALSLEFGSITLRKDAPKPSVRQFVAHLHRAAYSSIRGQIL